MFFDRLESSARCLKVKAALAGCVVLVSYMARISIRTPRERQRETIGRALLSPTFFVSIKIFFIYYAFQIA